MQELNLFCGLQQQQPKWSEKKYSAFFNQLTGPIKLEIQLSDFMVEGGNYTIWQSIEY